MNKTTAMDPAARPGKPPVVDSVGSFVRFFLSELKPKGKILTPFNVISGAIIALGIALIVGFLVLVI